MTRNIQQEILTQLLRTEHARYTDARPKGVANDLFNYHLQFLVQKGLVEKREAGYTLSDAGKRHVALDQPLSPLGRKVDLFKVNVLTIVLDRRGSDLFVLNQRRLRQPFYNHTGIMGGTVRRGEMILDAARRKLIEETGLEAAFTLLGVVRKVGHTMHQELFSDTFFYICCTDVWTGTLLPETAFGENMWVLLDRAIQHEEDASAPTRHLVALLYQLRTTAVTRIPLFYTEEVQTVCHI